MNFAKIAAVAVFATAVFALLPASLKAADEAPAAPPATSPSTGDQAAAALRFYGPITAIDAAAKTFTVGEQTFSVTPATHMSKPDDSEGTLADAKVGEPARGTYTKEADGKLNVVKVRFGKKTGGKSGGKSGGKKKTDAATTEPAAQ
jgi:uncharacterized protein DUF5666